MSDKQIEVEEIDESKIEDLYRQIANIEKPVNNQCYCNKVRDFNIPDFLCSNCGRWFHKSCIQFSIGKVLPFMTAYYFNCKNCNELGDEIFSRKQSNFTGMCQTALANLICKPGNNYREYYSKINDILPFLEEHWEALTTQPKKPYSALNSSIHKTLIGTDIFKCYSHGDDLIVCLSNPALHLMKPGYDQFKILASQLKTKVSTTGGLLPQSGGWHSSNRKRKANNNHVSSAQSAIVGSNVTTGNRFGDVVTNNGKPLSRRGIEDQSKVKMTVFNYPVDHPFNKENYRYIFVEPDPHAKGRQIWEECESTAGRIIPGFFYRVYVDPKIVLSTNDRGHQLKLSENQMSVTGDKGYCMVRATHPVSRGIWYYEAEIIDQPEGSHCRIGWSQSLGNLQAPCGFDKFGYSVRSHMGTAFHQSCGSTYMRDDDRGGAQRPTGQAPGYTKGDVLGCLFVATPGADTDISKYKRDAALQLPPAFKDRPLIKFKGSYYYEEKENPVEAEKNLHPLENSKLIFYKNGISFGAAFTEIFDGLYYPAVSVYKPCCVCVNFGPNFKYPPQDIHWKSMSDRYPELVAEQALSDMRWMTSNKDKIEQTLNGGR